MIAPCPSARETAADVRAGRITARSVVEETLARIARLDPALNAFTVVRAQAALAEADALDAHGPHQGPLAGVPIAVKEEYDVAGDVTSLGGAANTRPASRDCETIRRLREAGAVIVGRTNMPEFGQVPAGESEHHGATLNPWDLSRSPGGSSAGSAVAVAAGIVPIAMGADGGGSLRIPASACGVFGLKPTRGRVSSAPLAEHWHGLATFGAITRTAEDMALVMEVISGNDPVDRWRVVEAGTGARGADEDSSWDEAGAVPTVLSAPGVLAAPDRPLRILVATPSIMPGAHPSPEVAEAIRGFAERLGAAGHDVREGRVRWPWATAPFLALYAAGVYEESRQVDDPKALASTTRTIAAVGARVRPWAVRAAERSAERMRLRVQEAFGGADLILIPTLLGEPGGAHDLEGRNALSALAASTPVVSNTALFNVTGHPAASMFAGLTPEGLPVGAQVVARSGCEGLILRLARDLDAHGGVSGPVPPIAR
ncbi:amidase family protein [Actinomyces sp. B33]|uniref:amidase n=1 Tax=Actinomyces sp. B33 TaxID=2942131 RepID=UPI0023414E29|nr:amidase family protein [Actinomyces sp. B33]MDC4233898.1 amidase family protein [Actinomyces sp. B33]